MTAFRQNPVYILWLSLMAVVSIRISWGDRTMQNSDFLEDSGPWANASPAQEPSK